LGAATVAIDPAPIEGGDLMSAGTGCRNCLYDKVPRAALPSAGKDPHLFAATPQRLRQ
jgi:hypothetical protein